MARSEDLRGHATRRDSTRSRQQAFQELRRLRQELPKLSAAEIVRAVHDARADSRLWRFSVS
jgi:hypothetical protein